MEKELTREILDLLIAYKDVEGVSEDQMMKSLDTLKLTVLMSKLDMRLCFN